MPRLSIFLFAFCWLQHRNSSREFCWMEKSKVNLNLVWQGFLFSLEDWIIHLFSLLSGQRTTGGDQHKQRAERELQHGGMGRDETIAKKQLKRVKGWVWTWEKNRRALSWVEIFFSTFLLNVLRAAVECWINIVNELSIHSDHVCVEREFFFSMGISSL